MTSEDKLDAALKNYLRSKDIEADSVWFDSEFERGWGGCHTCGYGGSEDSITYTLYWRSADDWRDSGQEEFNDLSDLLKVAVEFSE